MTSLPASPEILGMSDGEFAIAFGTLLFGEIRRWWLERQARALLMRSVSVTKYDPGCVVEAYARFREYWPTAVEEELDEAFKRRENILLIGRPHVGKTRAAVHHFKKHLGKRWPWSRWRVIEPLPQVLDALLTLRIPKRRYVLWLDDLDWYLRHDESQGAGVLQLVRSLQRQAKELMVVATVRRTPPEFDVLAQSSPLLGRWHQIEIPVWTDDMGSKLAKELGADLQTWDGTPLSVIRPSSLMTEWYRQAPLQQQKALRMLKLCFENGLFFFPSQLLFSLCNTAASGIDSECRVNQLVVNELFEKGWLVQSTEPIQSFPGIVSYITDWTATAETREILKSVLVGGRWHQQLAGFGSARVLAGDLTSAREAYETAVSIDSSREAYHYRLGVVFLLLREWTAAVTSFECATQLKPRWATAWFRLARALREAGDFNRSRNAFQRAIALGSSDPQARFFGGEILRLEGRYDEATAELREAVRLDPNNGDAWFALGRTLRACNDWSAAQEAAFAHATQCKPDMAVGWFYLGKTFRIDGRDVNETLGHLQTARKLGFDPTRCDLEHALLKLHSRRIR